LVFSTQLCCELLLSNHLLFGSILQSPVSTPSRKHLFQMEQYQCLFQQQVNETELTVADGATASPPQTTTTTLFWKPN